MPWECILWDRGILLPNITMIKTTHVPTGHPQFFLFVSFTANMLSLESTPISHCILPMACLCVFLRCGPYSRFCPNSNGFGRWRPVLGKNVPHVIQVRLKMDPIFLSYWPDLWPLNIELWIWGVGTYPVSSSCPEWQGTGTTLLSPRYLRTFGHPSPRRSCPPPLLLPLYCSVAEMGLTV